MWVARMVAKLTTAQKTRRRPPASDATLADRAAKLSAAHLGGAARPVSVRWVSDMRTRWGSCTPATATIRISDRLKAVPDWVLDYILVHELAHLLVAGHGPDFWALVANYPRTERARGYLEGLSAAGRLGLSDD